MANRNEIINRIAQLKQTGQDIVRREYLAELYQLTKHDTIIYAVPFAPQIPGIPANVINITSVDIQGFMTCLNGLKGDKLDLILHSPGGSLEAAEQLVQYLRAKYSYIRAIVPQNAMSAATMIACACDEIVLGKQSAIGPIDPQMAIPRQNGVAMSLPAHSILADFEKAKSDIAKDKNSANVWIPKIMELPNGILDLCQKTIELSKSKVAEWLNTYMFKDDSDKKGQAIAEWLGNFEEHKTHGRPINYDLAKSKGLKVTRLEDDQEFQDKVLSVYHATLVTFDTVPCIKIIENHKGKGSYVTIQVQAQILPQQMV
jgi:hypothetical protein